MDIAVFSLVNHFEISVFSQIYHEQISKGGWNQIIIRENAGISY
jgi:hypothetical protein